MNFDLKDKVAIVTGGAMGIGEAAARKLAAEGAAVAILDLDRDAAAKTAAEIAKGGAICDFFVCDVSNASEVARAVEAVVTTTEQAWDRLMGVNLKGCFLVSKFAVPHMLNRSNTAIVVVGSVQSMTAIGNSVAYVTAKHGLLGLTRAMALDYARKGIRVNCVCPGAIDTPMLRRSASLDPDPEKVIRSCDRAHAMGRIGRSEEVADAIVYLASPLSSFITGATLVVDGGMLVPAGGMGFHESGTGAAAKK
jgi:NAD(P)-dependent dehydrogenase (short-subunit alcohol dehydrogenase family)